MPSNLKKCLIIVGMHRSGTSYTASLLQKSGLNIGTNLLAASTGNDLGHYEDEDFLNLQMQSLKKRGLNEDGWSLQTISNFDENEWNTAKALINTKNIGQWGWKEPRTTLFLDVWEQLIPDAYYLFVYRKPWEVVDSIFRRNTDPELINNPELTIQNWVFYNQQILKHYNKHKNNSILIDIENIMQHPSELIQLLNSKFGFSLNHYTERIYDKTKFIKSNDEAKQAFCYTNFKFSIDLYIELQAQSTLPSISMYQHKGEMKKSSLLHWWYLAAQSQRLNESIKLKNDQSYLIIELQNKIEHLIQNETTQSTLINDLCNNIQELNIIKREHEDLVNEIQWIKKSIWWRIRALFHTLLFKKNNFN